MADVTIKDYADMPLVEINGKVYVDMEIDNFDFVTRVDLCEKCYNEICKYVFDFCGCGK